MARRKFRNQRHETLTERSFQEYLTTPAPQTSRAELMTLVRGGEDTFLELKVKLSNPEKIAQGIVALANTGGGVIVFGINDNLRVEGLDDAEAVRDELVRICREDIAPQVFPYIDIIAFDNGLRVVALDVEAKRRPYRTRDGRFFVRVGAEKREATREELSALMDEARPVRQENIVAVGARVEDIDEAHLWSFVREFDGDAFDGTRDAAGYPTAEVLDRDLMLAAPSVNGVVGMNVAPTIAGMLLFGRDERVAELVPRASVQAVRFAGPNTQSPKVESVQLSGNLHTVFESALRFVGRYCDLWDKRPRTFPGRGEDVEAPLPARPNYHRGALMCARQRPRPPRPRAPRPDDAPPRLRQLHRDHQPPPRQRLRAARPAGDSLRPPAATQPPTRRHLQEPGLRPRTPHRRPPHAPPRVAPLLRPQVRNPRLQRRVPPPPLRRLVQSARFKVQSCRRAPAGAWEISRG